MRLPIIRTCVNRSEKLNLTERVENPFIKKKSHLNERHPPPANSLHNITVHILAYYIYIIQLLWNTGNNNYGSQKSYSVLEPYIEKI